MDIAVTGMKGGIAKTTTAVHIAAYLNDRAPTILLDGDPNRSVTAWSRRGALPFPVVDLFRSAAVKEQPTHRVFDTQARPSRDDLQALVEGCDLLILPTTADALALDALMLTVSSLRELGASKFRILLSMVPPRPNRDGDEARAMLLESGLPVFSGQIRRLIAFQRAALLGSVVRDVKDPRAADAWSDYEAIGMEILP